MFLTAVLTCCNSASAQTKVGVQGPLVVSGAPVNGIYDFKFSIWANSTGVPQVGVTAVVGSVAVNDGYYQTTADFGPGVFAGQTLYLQVDYRVTGSGNPYVVLPRKIFPFAGSALYSDSTGALQGKPLTLLQELDLTAFRR